MTCINILTQFPPKTLVGFDASGARPWIAKRLGRNWDVWGSNGLPKDFIWRYMQKQLQPGVPQKEGMKIEYCLKSKDLSVDETNGRLVHRRCTNVRFRKKSASKSKLRGKNFSNESSKKKAPKGGAFACRTGVRASMFNRSKQMCART